MNMSDSFDVHWYSKLLRLHVSKRPKPDSWCLSKLLRNLHRQPVGPWAVEPTRERRPAVELVTWSTTCRGEGCAATSQVPTRSTDRTLRKSAILYREQHSDLMCSLCTLCLPGQSRVSDLNQDNATLESFTKGLDTRKLNNNHCSTIASTTSPLDVFETWPLWQRHPTDKLLPV